MTTELESEKPNINILISALKEYSETGEISSVRCDRCGELLVIMPIGETGRALSASCPCGRYKDTMRGYNPKERC